LVPTNASDIRAQRNHARLRPARTGQKDADVRAEMLDAFAEWAARVIEKNSKRG